MSRGSGKGKGVSFDGGPVGFKRPPAHCQFKPGQQRPVGSGRRKEQKDLVKLVEKLLRTRVTITEDGKRKRIPYLEAMLKQGLVDALKGTIHQKIQFLELLKRLAPNLLTPELQPIVIQMVPGDDSL